MKLLKLLLLTLVLITPASCISAKPTEPTNRGAPSSEAPAATSPNAQTNLANTRWVLESFGAPGAETPVIAGSNITLEFGADGQAGGSGGCNSYGGSYQVQDKTLSFSQIASTLMACADASMMQQEQQYLEALQSAGQFELTDSHLTIRYDNGQGALHFRQA
ncbi:MAG: META domain-containing protein [Chloroflexota bacterium]